jgi:hypothetical protein
MGNRRSVPRLGETPDAVWEEFRRLSAFPTAVGGNGFSVKGRFPVARLGTAYYGYNFSRGLVRLREDLTAVSATESEKDAFHTGLSEDRVEVLFTNNPGYESDYKDGVYTVKVLHRPLKCWAEAPENDNERSGDS